jgi:serine/threonine protein kinase
MKKLEEFYQKYELIKVIGKGCYSEVYKAKSKTDNKVYSIKIIQYSKLNEKNKKRTLNEIRILNSFSHPNILKLEEAFIHPKNNELWIVTEYLSGGDLSNYLKIKKSKNKNLSKKLIWEFVVQILLGIVELNKLKVIHRDIKPANIFLNKKRNLKIGDFNISKILDQKNYATTQIGTPYYLAPEIWQKNSYDSRCDIFSFGIIIYEMIYLKHPFLSNSKSELKEKILNKKLKLPQNHLGLLISKCLNINPNNRPTAENLLSNFAIQSSIAKYSLENLISSHKLCSNNYLKPKILLKDYYLLDIFLPKKIDNNSSALTFRKRINSNNENEIKNIFDLRKSLNEMGDNSNNSSILDYGGNSVYRKLSSISDIDPLGQKITSFSKNNFDQPSIENPLQSHFRVNSDSNQIKILDYCSLYDNKENYNKETNINVLPLKQNFHYNKTLKVRRKYSLNTANDVVNKMYNTPNYFKDK